MQFNSDASKLSNKSDLELVHAFTSPGAKMIWQWQPQKLCPVNIKAGKKRHEPSRAEITLGFRLNYPTVLLLIHT